MKSRITIEVDFDNNNLPVIQVLSQNSDDVRDKLLQSFLQSLQHTSRWCRIEYIGNFGGLAENPVTSLPFEFHKWNIRPIVPDELPDEIKLMEVVATRA